MGGSGPKAGDSGGREAAGDPAAEGLPDPAESARLEARAPGGLLGVFLRPGQEGLRQGGFLLLVALLLAAVAAREVHAVYAAGRLRPVEARITDVDEETFVTRGRGGEGTTWTLRYRYSYEVDGVTHVGTRWGLRSPAHTVYVRSNGGEAGDTVTAYVDRADPSRAVLHREDAGSPGLWVAMALGVLVLGAWCLVSPFRVTHEFPAWEQV